ncbi:MAG: nucleotide exchange factor GrpE, partial [Ignavibacteria bacterium]
AQQVTEEKGLDVTSSETLKEEIEKLKSECEQYKDAYLRKAADFENYKRRMEAELSNYIKYASESLIKELIPVYDDMQRSMVSIEKGETKDFDTLRQGFTLIFEKFRKILTNEGVKEIDIKGKEFDVNLCDALYQEARDDVPPNTVVDVVEKGYLLKDKVIKHAKVIVSTEAKQ